MFYRIKDFRIQKNTVQNYTSIFTEDNTWDFVFTGNKIASIVCVVTFRIEWKNKGIF